MLVVPQKGVFLRVAFLRTFPEFYTSLVIISFDGFVH